MSGVVTMLSLSMGGAAWAADYTGDGIDDLVVGVPYEADIGGIALPGAIQVIRGSSTGLTATGDAFLHQNSVGVPSANAQADYFGYALGAGDIDGDGVDDVVVGGPSEGVGAVKAGSIWRLELSATATAISVAGGTSFSQDTAGVSDVAEAYDGFGTAVAVADFDGDGFDDVVTGIPGEAVGAIARAGAIEYLRGSSGGLTTVGQRFYHQDTTDVDGTAEADDEMGGVLASGDFDGDGYADLAIGMPNEDWVGSNEGAVQVMYGGPSGPSVLSPNDEQWTQGHAPAVGTLDSDNACGSALAVADFDGDGYDDLAIGCPGDDGPGATEAGSVLVVYGSSGGLSGSEIWDQSTAGVSGTAEAYDRFGEALTAGDYNGDGRGDLAVGVPSEDYVYANDGVVQLLPGSSLGLTEVGNLILSQDTGVVVLGTPAANEFWGSALTSGDYNADGRDDLVVGSPYDADGGATDGGMVNVFPGAAAGPSTTGDQWFHQNIVGIDDTTESWDQFGFSLR